MIADPHDDTGTSFSFIRVSGNCLVFDAGPPTTRLKELAETYSLEESLFAPIPNSKQARRKRNSNRPF